MIPNPFLKEIASLLLQPGAYNLAETCVVFPNKRARLYLGKYLGELTDKPVWAPRYLTISELMESLSGYMYADRLTLLFELYDVFSDATGSKESFDNFFPYSDALLADYDEIDKYMVNAADLFGNLAGLKDLEGRFNYLTDTQVEAIKRFWGTFEPGNESPGQQTFLSLWDALPAMYAELRKRLQHKGLANEGMAYRKVAEGLAEGEIQGLQYSKYLFIGFNALNKCEERLFRFLKNTGRAEFYWDFDTWYTNNEIHEAGYFIRNNLRDFPPARIFSTDNLLDKSKSISFLPVASNNGQADILPLVFEKLGFGNGQENLDDTALVLADESLLVPVLYAIPEYVKGVNITMGYPMAGSVVFNLVDALFSLWKNKKTGNDGYHWFYKDVLSVMGNPLLQKLYHHRYEDLRQIVIEKNLVYLNAAEILPGNTEDIIFREPDGTCSYLLRVSEYIIRQLLNDEEHIGRTDTLQLEVIYQLYTFLTRLADILTLTALKPGADTLFRLIRSMLRTLHIPFNGEPLAGLQVLGILETRTLDFSNVIILSMNEGVMPRVSNIPSFVPQSLRIGFGLPTPEHQDSMMAYYFYRLIQRAKNVVLVYDNSTGGLRTGERSRFMHQLYYELPVQVSEITAMNRIAQITTRPIQVYKTEDVAETLYRYSGTGGRTLSPSAINEFLNCPLRFYFHHIAGLPQPDEVAEEVDPRIFGNVLHKAIRHIYGNVGNGEINPAKLENILQHEVEVDESLDKAFNEEFFGAPSGTHRKIEGINLVIRQVIRKYLLNLIRADKETGPFRIVDLEQRFLTSVDVLTMEGNLNINVGGIIDRVDESAGRIRILDYKTGSVKNAFTTVESLFVDEDKPRNDAAFQVILYSWIYNRFNPGKIIVPGLYFVRESHDPGFSSTIRYGSGKPLENFSTLEHEFEQLLGIHLARLFDLRQPFSQTSNLETCKYCPYNVICRREGGGGNW